MIKTMEAIVPDLIPHSVIIGGGFGGRAAARSPEKAAVRIALIGRTNHHSFQPLLYRVATSVLTPATSLRLFA